MKIQYISDLHLEFRENLEFLRLHPIEPVGEILILAGDIIPFDLIEKADPFFDFCADNFEQTYWIPGNHEFYHGKLDGRTGSFEEKIKTNVLLLNNKVVERKNVRIVFSTLWTRISESRRIQINYALNDYRYITFKNRKLGPADTSELFEQNLNFIRTSVSENEQDKCIVVSHHVPTFENYPSEYKSSVLNEAFATELSDYILSSGIDFWIYGHHHRNVEKFKIGETCLLTNQLGYVANNEHLKFNRSGFITTD